jgi:hypothetical protein
VKPNLSWYTGKLEHVPDTTRGTKSASVKHIRKNNKSIPFVYDLPNLPFHPPPIKNVRKHTGKARQRLGCQPHKIWCNIQYTLEI